MTEVILWIASSAIGWIIGAAIYELWKNQRPKGNYLMIQGTLNTDLTVWLHNWEREHPDIPVYVNGIKVTDD